MPIVTVVSDAESVNCCEKEPEASSTIGVGRQGEGSGSFMRCTDAAGSPVIDRMNPERETTSPSLGETNAGGEATETATPVDRGEVRPSIDCRAVRV